MNSSRLRYLVQRLTINGRGLSPTPLPKSRVFINLAGVQYTKTESFCSVCSQQNLTVNSKEARPNNITSQTNLIIRRFKKSGKRKDDLEDSVEEGKQVVTVDVGSLRLDAFAKATFGVSRAKIEELFYKGDIYVNGERPNKKSVDIVSNDEIDIVKGVDPEDHNLVLIKRVNVVKLPDKATDQGRMKVVIHRWQNLVVKAYGSREE